jgi:AcrR family transcriptional regulator
MKKNPNSGKRMPDEEPPKTKPSRRQQKKDRTKQEILTAALHLFRTKGVEHTAAKEISDKAKIAEGTFFNYFPTKEDLALYFFQKGTNDLIDWYENQSELRKAPIHEKLFGIVHHQLEQIEPYEEFIGAVFFRSLQPQSRLNALSLESQELRLKYLRFIGGVLQEAAVHKEIPDVGDLGAYGFGLFYMGIVTFWLHDNSRGKQKTLALLDRSLKALATFLSKGGWDWK